MRGRACLWRTARATCRIQRIYSCKECLLRNSWDDDSSITSLCMSCRAAKRSIAVLFLFLLPLRTTPNRFESFEPLRTTSNHLNHFESLRTTLNHSESEPGVIPYQSWKNNVQKVVPGWWRNGTLHALALCETGKYRSKLWTPHVERGKLPDIICPECLPPRRFVSHRHDVGNFQQNTSLVTPPHYRLLNAIQSNAKRAINTTLENSKW